MNNLLEKIKSTPKYTSLNESTISRVIESLAKKYPEKQLETEVRSKLHQIWGAYYSTRPNFQKLIKKIEDQKSQGIPTREIILPLLMIHSSTKERLPILENYYQEIFAITGIPNSITDYGCGFNPLTLPWMQLPSTAQYTAYDIDIEEVEFLNKALKMLAPVVQAQCKVGDLYEYSGDHSDVVFLLKILPLLEQQEKGSTEKILDKVKCKHLVISYPISSLGGKDRGMFKTYRDQCIDIIQSKNWHYDELMFPTELLFVVKK